MKGVLVVRAGPGEGVKPHKRTSASALGICLLQRCMQSECSMNCISGVIRITFVLSHSIVYSGSVFSFDYCSEAIGEFLMIFLMCLLIERHLN